MATGLMRSLNKSRPLSLNDLAQLVTLWVRGYLFVSAATFCLVSVCFGLVFVLCALPIGSPTCYALANSTPFIPLDEDHPIAFTASNPTRFQRAGID